MKVGLESSVLINKNRTGVDYYTYHLYKEVIAQMPSSLFYLCYISFITKKKNSLGVEARNTRTHVLSFLPGRIYHFLLKKFVGLPYDVLAGIKPDIFVFPNFIRWPLALTKKSVIIVYDLSYIVAREYAGIANSNYLTRQVPRSIEHSSHVVVISENVKQEVINEYGTDPNKLTVIYPAVDHNRFKPASSGQITQAKAKYGITGKYILSVGTIEPRKNLAGLLKAYDALSAKLKQEYTLVLSGGKGWLDDEIQELHKKVSQTASVIKTGYVSDEDLPTLYSGSEIFVFPSFYEGFGMPPLEAMACGTPVIVSDNSSLPEVVGTAGLYVQATNTSSIAEAMTRLLSSAKLRDELKEKGLKQAQEFSWEKSGAEFKAVLERVNRES